MLKNILNLEGAQQLSKNEQSIINGGQVGCMSNFSCPIGTYCCYSTHSCTPTGNVCAPADG